MTAQSVSHGVINIDVKNFKASKPSSVLQAEAPLTAHPISTGPTPESVVVHKTSAQIAEEAVALQAAAEQLQKDAANVAPAA